MLKKILHRHKQSKSNPVRDLAFRAPVYWDQRASAHPEDRLDSDFCVIDTNGSKHYFVRGILDLPIKGTGEVFGWGVWVTLSEKNLQRYKAVYGTQNELDEEHYFGWLANEIPGYDDCLTLKTSIHLQGGGMRPLIVLNHDDHPLYRDQHEGITPEQAERFVRGGE